MNVHKKFMEGLKAEIKKQRLREDAVHKTLHVIGKVLNNAKLRSALGHGIVGAGAGAVAGNVHGRVVGRHMTGRMRDTVRGAMVGGAFGAGYGLGKHKKKAS